MKYERIMIRFGELALKGRNRKYFIKKLEQNIRFMIREFPKAKIETKWDRMYVLLNDEPLDGIIRQLKKVFGIQSFSPVIKVDKDISKIKEAALELVQSIYKSGDTFKVSARRTDKNFELTSNELNHQVGAHILKNMENIKVNVKDPDINLVVEIRQDAAYLSGEVIYGAGGFPVHSNGKAMLMLSGGIDSPVAGFLTMKRGVMIEAVHFHSPPFTSERAKQKVLDIAEKLAEFSGEVKVHIVPFTKIQETIHRVIPSGYSMTTTRRMMVRITDEIRKQRDALAIVTGESLGQVASQTIESMYAINHVTNTPIIRPLVAMDKLEIIKIAEEIDTLEISNRPYEDCCTIFTPPSPKTKPNLEKVIAFEEKYDWEPIIDEAVRDVETITVTVSSPSSSAAENVDHLF